MDWNVFTGGNDSNGEYTYTYTDNVADLKARFTNWTNGDYTMDVKYVDIHDQPSSAGSDTFTVIESAPPVDPELDPELDSDGDGIP